MADQTIIGPENPVINGVKYRYKIDVPGNEILPGSVKWVVRHGLRVVESSAGGSGSTTAYTFFKPSAGNLYMIRANYRLVSDPETEQQATIFVGPRLGPPAITHTAWQDVNFQDIPPSRIMEYLDDVYLTVQTVNIPPGETIYIQINEKEAFGGRNVGTSMPVQVNEAGIARKRVSSQLLLDFANELNGKDWLDDIWHEYYAQVIYYGKNKEDIKLDVTIKEKTKILSVANKAGKTLEERNKRKSAVVDTADADAEKIPVKIKVNVYFDGTMGNKYNVELFEKDLKRRVKDENTGKDMPQNVLEEDVENCRWVLKDDQPEKNKILKDHADGDEGTSSYKQTLTGITNLYDLDKTKEKGKDTKLYIEGVGSIPYGEDDVLLGAGLGWTKDIDSKVTKAMAEILGKVRDGIDMEEECVEEVTVCVMGFSRGATTSRYFVSLRERLAMHALTSAANVVFKFLGLFDTVSSVMKKHPFQDSNVERYNLTVGSRVQKVVQLAAGDEYREKFPLTDITSSIDAGVGYELTLPGDHSDIGGGHKNYHLVENKQGLEVPVPGLKENMYKPTSFVDKLIEQGWYSEKDIIKRDKMYISQGPNFPPRYVDYTAVERTIWNSYRYIPLGIMIDFAAMYGEIPFDKGLQEENYSVRSPLLLSVKNTLHNFALSNDGARSVSAYDLIQGEKLRQLRNRYIHLSAKKEGGQSGFTAWVSATGRYKKGKPDREIIPG